MRLPKFEYFAPKTLETALNLLAEKGEGARVMAGGTDLVIKMKHGLLKPQAIIALKEIAGLDRIHFQAKKGLTIGATALLADVASHPDILKHYPSVAYAARETANVQIRNMGTVGGNICNAAPSADNAPTLIAMKAEATLSSLKGERRLPLDQLMTGPGSDGHRTGGDHDFHLCPPPASEIRHLLPARLGPGQGGYLGHLRGRHGHFRRGDLQRGPDLPGGRGPHPLAGQKNGEAVAGPKMDSGTDQKSRRPGR